MCWGQILNFNDLFHTISEPKGIGNWFCAPIIFRNPLKTLFFNKKYTITICVGCVWIVIGYFLFEKEAFNRFLKAIETHLDPNSVIIIDLGAQIDHVIDYCLLRINELCKTILFKQNILYYSIQRSQYLTLQGFRQKVGFTLEV